MSSSDKCRKSRYSLLLYIRNSRKVKIFAEIFGQIFAEETGKSLAAHRSKFSKRTKGNPVKETSVTTHEDTRMYELDRRGRQYRYDKLLSWEKSLLDRQKVWRDLNLRGWGGGKETPERSEIRVKISARSEGCSDSCVACRKHLVRPFTIHKVNVPRGAEFFSFFLLLHDYSLDRNPVSPGSSVTKRLRMRKAFPLETSIVFL